MVVVRTHVKTVTKTVRIKVPTRTGYTIKSVPVRAQVKVTTRTRR